jgi:hypothetical protein
MAAACRTGDIINPWETRGDLIARGYSESDAEEATAFRVFLRRSQDALTDDDLLYAHGDLAYLQRVVPEELTR